MRFCAYRAIVKESKRPEGRFLRWAFRGRIPVFCARPVRPHPPHAGVRSAALPVQRLHANARCAPLPMPRRPSHHRTPEWLIRRPQSMSQPERAYRWSQNEVVISMQVCGVTSRREATECAPRRRSDGRPVAWSVCRWPAIPNFSCVVWRNVSNI